MKKKRLNGLYAITDAVLTPPASLEAKVRAALAGGARIVQYRDKTDDRLRRHREARRLRELTRDADALLIVNDDIELTRAVHADGVHLGRDDTSLADARASLGPETIIGVSCYADLDRALRAAAAGADYVAFGAFYPSATKPEASAAPLALLGEARARLHTPVCAIGGITPANAAAVIAAGADMIAVVGGLFGAEDVETAARMLSALFEHTV